MILKKIISIFFLCIFLFSSVGYFVAFRLSQQEIRKAMHAQTLYSRADDGLVCVSVSAQNTNKIVWSGEEGCEFSYEGKMYDVVRSEKMPDGSMHYFCLNDSREEELLSNLSENIADQADAHKTANGKTARLLLKLFAVDYFSQPDVHLSFLSESDYLTASYIPACSSLSQEIVTPPPRFV
jgi:hypothetical protein